MIIKVIPYQLNFKFDAGTSRGILRTKKVWFVILHDRNNKEVFGIGECSPLPGLSLDDRPDFEENLHRVGKTISDSGLTDLHEINDVVPKDFPSIRFGLETGIMDLNNGGNRKIYEGHFYQGKKGILINGLIWMGDKDFMLDQLKKKVDAGYSCIKIKVGAISLEQELELLKYIRKDFSEKEVELRLDANGAFDAGNVFEVLDRFSQYAIHSIEQPIKAGNWELMTKVCQKSPIPIALDEELIAANVDESHFMLDSIKPAYIILKPSLLGGFRASQKWIDSANQLGIGWWITSALESNVGLNAIAQFADHLSTEMPQGLGTGQLYTNNLTSPLEIIGEKLYYNIEKAWDFTPIHL